MTFSGVRKKILHFTPLEQMLILFLNYDVLLTALAVKSRQGCQSTPSWS